MFDPNEPASPVTEFEPNGTCKEYRGLSKFEQCAKDFTAAALPFFLSKYYDRDEPEDHTAMIRAAQVGILTAEEFCRQMEERERNV